MPERRLWIGSGMGKACFLPEWLNLKGSGMMGGYTVPEGLADRGVKGINKGTDSREPVPSFGGG